MKARRVLLVDDSPHELVMIQDALLEAGAVHGVALDVLAAQNGRHAVRVLADCQVRGWLPDLILLDLNMPESGGFEFLVKLKTHPRFSRLCIIMFTSADHPQEIKKAYNERANAYVKKPFALSALKATMELIVGFWLTTNLVDALLD